jgi:hypothetical protein
MMMIIAPQFFPMTRGNTSLKAIFHPAIPVAHLIFTFGYLQTDLGPWRPSTILKPVMRLENLI